MKKIPWFTRPILVALLLACLQWPFSGFMADDLILLRWERGEWQRIHLTGF